MDFRAGLDDMEKREFLNLRVQPVASHCTDYAIPAPKNICTETYVYYTYNVFPYSVEKHSDDGQCWPKHVQAYLCIFIYIKPVILDGFTIHLHFT
jgi:hypothetical protein